jgi:hypothetical protein
MTQYKLVVDCATGKQEYVALTPAEIAERDQQAAAAAQAKSDEEAAAAAKQAEKEAIAARLGLSAEELSTLLS